MAKSQSYLGVTNGQALTADDLSRDIRPVSRRFIEWLGRPANAMTSQLCLAGAMFYLPEIADILIFFALGLFWHSMTRRESTPLKMPIQAGIPDPNEPDPATGGPTPSQGIFYLGNSMENGKELWLTNSDCRQHFLVLGTTGAGKALPQDATIHTPTGPRMLQELRVGDLVSTPDGRSAPITGYYPQGARQIARVTFEDGRSAEACSEHLWEVHLNLAGEASAPRILETQELARQLAAQAGQLSVRLPCPIEWPEASLATHPYSMGTLLGDCCECRDSAEALGSTGMTVSDKAIPQAYKHGSVMQRWLLVQGLMDKRGGVEQRDGALTFSSASEQLARDLQEVIWSLGGIASLSEDRGVRACWHLSIRHPEPGRFFSLESKVSLVEAAGKTENSLRLGITGVEMAVREADAACIRVDHQDHLFITQDYVVTHNTEALIGFSANALSWGSGLLFCDGKGDVSLFAKMFVMARQWNREDDVLVLNFMNGGEDVKGLNGVVRSNTLNPFATGSSDDLTQMVAQLMDDAGGDGAMWKGRATSMLTGLMKALTWARDNGELDLNVGAIRDHMSLKEIMAVASGKRYPSMPPDVRHIVKAYLTSLPGYVEEKGEKQAQTTLDQHGYLEMQFSKILGSLNDVYGHIFKTPFGEVDMMDVVLNRRILIVMLPALEKSGDEIANIGKIVAATLKGMMGRTLGNSIDGSWDTVVERRATTSPSPFMVILDEVGYYTVDGMALMAAQARSIGFMMVYASQDITAMKRNNEKEAASIVANTNTKIFMKTEDPGETTELAEKTGGKVQRARIGGMDRRVGEAVGRHWVEGENVSFEEANRINYLDLKSQGSGKMHVSFGGHLVRASSFYAAPEASIEKNSVYIRANHFIEVEKPSLSDIGEAEDMVRVMENLVDSKLPGKLQKAASDAISALDEGAAEGDDIVVALSMFEMLQAHNRPPIEAAAAAVAEVARAMRNKMQGFVDDVSSRTSARLPALPDDDDLDDDMTLGTGGNNWSEPAPQRRQQVSSAPPAVASGFVAKPVTPAPAKPVPPPMPFAPITPKLNIDRTAKHGTTVDDGRFNDMGNKLTASEPIMRALAALDFDPENATPGQVENDIEEAFGAPQTSSAEAVHSKARTIDAINAINAFERVSDSIQPLKTPPSLDELGDDDEEEDDGSGDFLSRLLLSDDDEDPR